MMFSLLKKGVSLLVVALSIASVSFCALGNDTQWSNGIRDYRTVENLTYYQGELYVLGTRADVCNYCDSIQKYDSRGILSWTHLIDPDASSGILVNETGVSYTHALYEEGVTLLNLDGQLVSERLGNIYPYSYFPGYTSSALIASDATGYYISVHMYSNSNYSRGLAKLDFDGNLVWHKNSPDLGNFRYHKAANGSLYLLTDALYTSDGQWNLTKYSSDGVYIAGFVGDDAIHQYLYANGVSYGESTFGIWPKGEYGSVENTSLLVSYDSNGQIEWQTEVFAEKDGFRYDGTIDGIFTNEQGVFVFGRADYAYHLAHYNFDGEPVGLQKIDLDFTIYIKAGSNAVHLYNNTLHIALISTSDVVYTAALDFDGERVPGATDLTLPGMPSDTESKGGGPELLSYIGDINSDGYQDIAVVTDGDEVAVSIESIGTDANLNSVVFDAITSVADVKVISDQNDNGAAEIALISEADSKVVIRDSLTGELINEVTFNSNVSPIKINFVADLNNNGSAEVALLGSFTNGNGKVVMVKDSASGELLHTVYFNPNFAPKDFAFVADINGDAAPEVAVLSTDSNNTSKFEIRSLNGEMIKNIWLGKAYNSTQLVTLPVAENHEPTLATALGALQTKVNGNGLTVRMMDTQSGAEIQSVNYNSNFNPITAKAISDINSNGTPEVAVLGSNTDTTTGETSTKIEVKDSYSGNLVKNIWQNKTVTPIDLTIVADINGNGSPETVTLVEQNDSFKAIVKDSLTGELLDAVAVEIE